MRRLLLRVIIPIILCWSWSRCANIQSPTGGPKDKKPPTLVSSIPLANQTGYHGKSILLTFDETVKLNDPREQIIISPSPGKEVEFEVKNNRVFITPKDPWADSTTYSIQFREGIQDVTESNVPPNLRLAFSTGTYIDSLSLTGNVIDLLEGTPQEQITVAIYAEDTFNIFEHTPTYFTKTDKQGKYRLENIRAGRFYIYAFNDQNKNLKVESRSEIFGFLKDPFTVTRNIDTLNIGLVRLDSRPLRISSIRNMGKLTRIKFSKSLLDYTLTADRDILSAFGDNASEVNIWSPQVNDSLLIKFAGRDSLLTSKDTTFYLKTTDVVPPKETFRLNMEEPTINPDNGRLTTTITFTKPVTRFLFDSLYIKVDTTDRIPITREDATYNTTKKQLVLSKGLGKKMFGPDANPLLVLALRNGFAISVDDDSTKNVTKAVTIFWPEENGIITIQANTRNQSFVLQLLDRATKKVVAESINSKLVAKNIPPSDYSIRAIIDDNKNGKWDAGNILKRIEPEKVVYYKAADGSRSVPVRANWEIGPLQFSF